MLLRVTVKPYLQPYVQQLAEQWGVDDATELVNLIIFEHRRSKLSNSDSPQLRQPKSELEELSGLLS